MLLEVTDLQAGYGAKRVLHDVSVSVGEREIVAVLGHNGAGKSTLMHAIFGLLPATHGRIVFDGRDLTRSKPDAKLRAGLGYSPQGAPIFNTLSVEDNLLMGGYAAVTDAAELASLVAKVEKIFPRLKERRHLRAGSLSGGERQMLALGMVFVASPRLVILDEPSGGLSPVMVDNTYDAISAIARDLRASVLLVEQDIDQALRIATRVYVLSNGRIRFEGSPEEIRSPAHAKLLLGL
jgi:branched-chain amino acid transport system ATP-binding protein